MQYAHKNNDLAREQECVSITSSESDSQNEWLITIHHQIHVIKLK